MSKEYEDFSDKELDEYLGYYQDRCQFYQPDTDVYAVVGGWPIELYEDEWVEEREGWRFLLLTLKDCEPWVQLALDPNGKFVVEQRVS